MADDASSHVPGGRSMANAASQRRGAPLRHLLASVRASVTRPVSSAASAPLSNHFFGPPRSNCPHGEEPSLPIFSWPSFLGALPGLSIPVMFVFTCLFCDFAASASHPLLPLIVAGCVTPNARTAIFLQYQLHCFNTVSVPLSVTLVVATYRSKCRCQGPACSHPILWHVRVPPPRSARLARHLHERLLGHICECDCVLVALLQHSVISSICDTRWAYFQVKMPLSRPSLLWSRSSACRGHSSRAPPSECKVISQ
jgi:hypothetical protein